MEMQLVVSRMTMVTRYHWYFQHSGFFCSIALQIGTDYLRLNLTLNLNLNLNHLPMKVPL